MLSFLPNFIFRQLTDIRPEFLMEQGIALLLIDFDNTMLPYTQDEPTPQLLSWFDMVRSAGISVCIVSNSHKQRVPIFSEKYSIDCVTHASKPGTRGINEALARYHVPRKSAALVGDQIFTDVLGANRAGITAMIVKSIHNHTILLKLRHILELPFLWIAHNRRVMP